MVKSLFEEVKDEVLKKSVPTIQRYAVKNEENQKTDEDVKDSSPRLA